MALNFVDLLADRTELEVVLKRGVKDARVETWVARTLKPSTAALRKPVVVRGLKRRLEMVEEMASVGTNEETVERRKGKVRFEVVN